MSRHAGRRTALLSIVIALTLIPTFVASATPMRGTPLAPRTAEAQGIEQFLPPGARNVLAVFRVFKALSARNRVYREAGHVQRDLRAYYDALIAKAQEQMLNREQLGLRDSQFRAYERVLAKLKAEREFAIQITEDEKRAAKYGFESRLKRELLAALVRSPGGQSALTKMKESVEEFRDELANVKALLEGENPINVGLDKLREKADKVAQFGELAGMLHGPLGEKLGEIAQGAHSLADRVEAPIEEAAAALGTGIEALNEVADGLDVELEQGRRVRADSDVVEGFARDLAASALERLLSAGGAEGDVDAVVDAIMSDLERNVLISAGQISPGEQATMRERVRAEVLRARTQGISEQCGKLVGALQRAARGAAESGEEPPASNDPCTLYQNNGNLQEMVDELRGGPVATGDEDTDGDRIRDADDLCVERPEDYDGFEDFDGCPDPDNDGDSIPDAADKCPDEAGTAETDGCPVAEDPDADGIVGEADKCPNEAGTAETDGCPVAEVDDDPDEDGIVGDADKCPNEAGTAENDGCPDAEVAQEAGRWVRGDARVVGGTSGNYTSNLGPSGGTVAVVVQTNAGDAPGQALFEVAWEPPPSVMTPSQTEVLEVAVAVASLEYEGGLSLRLSPTVYLGDTRLRLDPFVFVDMSCTSGACSTTPSSVGRVDFSLGAGSRDGEVQTIQYAIHNCSVCVVEWDYTWTSGASGSNHSRDQRLFDRALRSRRG